MAEIYYRPFLSLPSKPIEYSVQISGLEETCNHFMDYCKIVYNKEHEDFIKNKMDNGSIDEKTHYE